MCTPAVFFVSPAGLSRLTFLCASLPWRVDAGYDPGDVTDFSRATPEGGTLAWQLAYRHYTRTQMGAGSGAVPFLIDWLDSTSPAASAPAGCELVELHAEATDPPAVAKHLQAVGIDPKDLQLAKGPRDRLVAVIKTPKGIVEF